MLLIKKTHILIFLSYWFVFIQLPYFPGNENSLLIKTTSIITFCIVLIYMLFKLFKKKFFWVNVILFSFVLLMMMSGVSNYGSLNTVNPLLSSFLISIRIIGLFLMIEYLTEINQFYSLIVIYSRLTSIFVIFNDIIILIFPTLTSNMEPYYFIGNKFAVIYTHLQLLVLLLVRKNVEQRNCYKIYIILLAFLTAFMALRVECMTGLTGLIIFISFCILIKVTQNIFYNPAVFFASLIVSSLFVIAYEIILRFPLIQNLIISVFNRSLTLTGRTYIYANLFQILKEHWLWGYGYGSSYEICVKYLHFADTQNGIFEWILQSGIFVTACLVILLLVIINLYKKSKERREYFIPVLALLYTFLVLSSVEITIDMHFIFLLSILFGWSIQK
ncbi:putative uncharacterized protein [Blautia hydrogenotrophica CAG:147]|uniref:O-antigen ligase family protein n=1 Tax=Blautia hydrogenotrophica TaxID=53443 RepID=UPI00033DB9D1|nr:O-antigen ligase family protein [Blautia hydrogenotrophica]CCX59790.1 putative uncharacterized protein [Blautia hydrogenotrophica CAG:147]